MAEQRIAAAHDQAHLANAIRESGGDKVVAIAARVSVNTASRYRRGLTVPDGMRLMRLMRWSRRIAEAVLWLAGLDDAGLDAKEARANVREATLTQELHALSARHGLVAPLGEPPDSETATHDALGDAKPGADKGSDVVGRGPNG